MNAESQDVQDVYAALFGAADQVKAVARSVSPDDDTMCGAIDRGARTVANAITPIGAAPARMPDGSMVGSLTEAVIYSACGLHEVALAIRDLARAVREHGGTP